LGEAADRVRELLGDAELVLGNLECALSLDGYRADSWTAAQMRGWPVYARDLARAGFTHLSLANNHANQHGDRAFHETAHLLQKAGIEPCGLRGEDGWCTRPVVTELPGASVAVLAYSLRPLQYGAGPAPYAQGTEAGVLGDVARIRREVDRVVVSLHWGEEYGGLPSAGEVTFARRLVDAGVSLLVGHHPHVLRPVEVYGEGVVAYSLGNFLSNMIWMRELRESLVLRCDLLQPAGSAALAPARIGEEFLPEPVAPPPGLGPVQGLAGLSPEAYARQTERTEAKQRRTSYAFALRHLHRFSRPVLGQLMATTVRNKLAGLLGGD
jgi:poly-gamma-glutamate synthesis protein (capsule biosynthesis protein)